VKTPPRFPSRWLAATIAPLPDSRRCVSRHRVWLARCRTAACCTALLLLQSGSPAQADDSVTGVCPDGSFFVASSRAQAPCPDAKFVPASELPPIRPEYLPRPYTWYVDQEEQDANNPYNLVDKAQKIRELRRAQNARAARQLAESRGSATEGSRRTEQAGLGGESMNSVSPGMAAGTTPGRALAPATGPVGPQGAVGPAVSLDADELRTLAELIALRQQVAPAEIAVDDVRGNRQLGIQFAYSEALEQRIRAALGDAAEVQSARVIVFGVLAEAELEFYPRFFVTQSGRSFRPLDDSAKEQGLLLGQPGPQAPGLLTLGYLVLPAAFDLRQSLTLWWNDRRVDAVLQPVEVDGGGAPGAN